MTTYNDILIDLPERSLALLTALTPDATKFGLDATLLLMAVSMAFIVPKERLVATHPAGDKYRLSKGPSTFNFNTPFIDSPFKPDDYTDWQFGHVNGYGDGPDSWTDWSALETHETSQVLGIIRNAISHGNLYTQGDPISNFLFYSEKIKKRGKEVTIDGYNYLSIPIEEFRAFLYKWFTYIKDADVKCRKALMSTIDGAA